MPKLSRSFLCYGILACAFLLRLYFVLHVHPVQTSIFSDMRNYVQIADGIGKGEWLATHFFQPIGFPLIIHWFKTWTQTWYYWLGLLQVLLSTITVGLTWKSAEKNFGERVGMLTLILAAFHIPWVIYAGYALSETVFCFLLSLMLFLTVTLYERKTLITSALWGLCFILAFYIKGTHVFLFPLSMLILYRIRRKLVVPACLVVLTGLILHGLFTNQKIGKFQMSASAGGLNFVEGKCPLKNNADSIGYSWLSPIYHQMGKTQIKQWDRPFTDSSYYMREGFSCIANEPLVLIQSLEGIPLLFYGNYLWPANYSPWADSSRLFELYFAFFVVVGLAIYFLDLRAFDSERLFIWTMPMIALFVCVYVFKSEARFRLPFDVWFIPVGAYGWLRLLHSNRA